MMHFQIPIAGLMAAVLFLAVALAALKSRSPLWASLVFSLTILILLLPTVAVVFSRSPTLVGFVIFSWAYLIAAFITTPIPRLVTSLLAEEAFIRVNGLTALPKVQAPPSYFIHSQWSDTYYESPDDRWGNLLVIVNSLLSPIFGLIGVVVAHMLTLQARSQSPRAPGGIGSSASRDPA